MTIMLLPDERVIFLHNGALDLDEARRYTEFANEFLSGTLGKSIVIDKVSFIIDARCTPAIRIEVPK